MKIAECRTALDVSRERVLGTAEDGGTILTQATGARMVAAWTLAPAPRDPVRHLEAAHGRARSHLARLTAHDTAREVPSVMTNELFSRLTDARPVPLTASAGVHRYTYTPRKALRRVLDHALDHLNQIDQWLAWRNDGVVPTPTDGWVPSTVTLPDDRLPLTRSDLEAWLWRIDQAARLLLQRAAGLTEAELDWLPPDGGWPLRRVLHHVAGRSCCTRHRSTKRCRRRIPGADTRRRVGGWTRPWGRRPRVARTRRSCTRDSTAFSAGPRRWSTTCWSWSVSFSPAEVIAR